ncbi:serine-rich adhesin for platelets [Dermacentor albipictus]|uniref:serine-rich adhesin for platelets n=1 Tax=Dermacentor albipictus TaxID=60249 RepID=UPI0031FD5CF2
MAPAKSGSSSATSMAHSMMMPRCTMSITRTKGLLNMPGQNNCFLNSAVQVLWHLDIFRRSFRDLSGHICMSDSCIFCALKELFAQFQYSQESALPPDALRRALAETFFDQRRFQLGFMDDAAECFENILQRIHFHIASQEVEDMCNVAHCIPHQKFAMTLVEQTVCHVCGASSEPLPFTQMVHYVSASALCLQASLVHSKEQKPVSFGELLRRAGGMGDIRDCPSSCGAKIQICKTLMNRPDIVSLGLVWDSERPSVDHIVDVLDSIGMTVNMDEMFHKVVDTRWASTVTHHLVGIVTYYGKHYSTFFFHTKLCVWIYFDDATVREIGPHWQQVVDKCHRGHFQPLLLLYANPNGTPVSTATAPTSVIHYISEHKKKQMDVKRSTSEKHRYGQQNGKKSEHLPAGMHISGDVPWSRGNYLNSKKGISMGGRSAMQEPLPILDMAFAHCAKPRARTYSDTSIMSERPYEPHGSGSDLEAQHTMEGVRHMAKQAGRDSTLDADINSTYISRQAVESVLSLQHLQRQRALLGASTSVVPGSRNSSSSLESFENSLHMREKASDCVDGTCRRRDSGNWSGDRNSASSASSTSLDGPYYCASGVRRACGSPGRAVNNFSKHEYSNIGMLVDKGYDSYSLSSTDSYPSAGMPGSPAKADPRLQQIPEAVHISNRLERAIHHSLLQGSDSASDSVFDDVFTSGKGEEESQDCEKLCSQAEVCLKMSYEKEQTGDLKMAIFFSDSAAAKARAAMDAPYGNAQSLIAAKMKHSMSVMRSSNLSKRLKEAEERRRGKELNGYDAHHSRQGSRDSTHSRHTRQGSRDSACTVIDLSEPVKSIEIYATLPKKSSKKKSGALFSHSSLRLKDDVEVYKDFLADRWHTSSQDDSAIKIMSDGEYTLNPKTNMRNGVGSLSETNGAKMKDPEFSDYSSEWEQSKKPSLHRTLSNPTGMKNHDADDANNVSASMKKQHRIRRKLMGGFMRRKNRSLPDLREGKDAPQTESRALDDNVIFDAKNERGMKQESSNEDETREDHSATIKRRGFHQPHRAFVNRNYAQRPLLTKVDPPQVDGVTSSTSLHQRSAACEQQEDSAKLASCWPQPRQQPSESAISSTTLHQRNVAFEQQDSSAKQAPCWPQTRQQPSEMFGNKTMGVDVGSFSDPLMPSPALSLSKGLSTNQGTVLEPNSFLKELHNKRTQILKSLPKSPDNVRNQGGESAMQVKLEQHSSAAPSGNSWLCELQSKQMAMLKKGDRVDDVKTSCDKDLILSGKEEALRQPLMLSAPQVAHKHAYPADNQATQAFNGSIQSSGEQYNESAEEQEDIKPKSVKDLALKFEKILRPAIPDQEVSTVHEESQLTAAKEPSLIANKSVSAPAGNLVMPRDSSCESQTMSTSALAMRSEKTNASTSLQAGSENTSQGRPFGAAHVPQPATVPCHRTANPAIHSQPMAPAGQTFLPHNLATPPCSSGSFPPAYQALSPSTPCTISSARHHASYTRPFVPQSSFQSTSPVMGTMHGSGNHLAPSHGEANLLASSLGVSSHGASGSAGASYVTASYEQKPSHVKPPAAQQQYGKAFQYAKPDPAETRSFTATRGPPAVSVVSETMLHSTSSNSDSSKRPTRPPDYETALQRLEMIKEQQRTTSPDSFQFPTKTPPDVLQGQQLPQPEVELGKKRKTALKKCVTFSDEVVLVACAEEEEDDYVPNPLLERVYRQHAAKQDSRECHEPSQFEDISSVHSSDSCDSVCHVDSVVKPHDGSQVPCNLCHKKFVSPPTVYCPDCAFYMSRFQKRT